MKTSIYDLYMELLEDSMSAERRKSIIEHMNVLLDCRMFLLNNKKSYESQMSIKKNRFNGEWIEIESPAVGGTEADWIRLNYDDCYLFLHDDGTETYQLDPLGLYGDELIDADSYDNFLEELDKLGNIEEYYS